MKKQEIVAQYRATALVSFTKADAYDLQGWVQTYELWADSGMNKADFGQVLQDANLNKQSTVKQNLSHISWALELLENEIDEPTTLDVVSRWASLNAIRSERYPNNTKSTATVKVEKVSKAFDAKAQAKQMKKELTRKQIAELIAELIA